MEWSGYFSIYEFGKAEIAPSWTGMGENALKGLASFSGIEELIICITI